MMVINFSKHKGKETSAQINKQEPHKMATAVKRYARLNT
jgi:hypothetical protein